MSLISSSPNSLGALPSSILCVLTGKNLHKFSIWILTWEEVCLGPLQKAVSSAACQNPFLPIRYLSSLPSQSLVSSQGCCRAKGLVQSLLPCISLHNSHSWQPFCLMSLHVSKRSGCHFKAEVSWGIFFCNLLWTVKRCSLVTGEGRWNWGWEVTGCLILSVREFLRSFFIFPSPLCHFSFSPCHAIPTLSHQSCYTNQRWSSGAVRPF